MNPAPLGLLKATGPTQPAALQNSREFRARVRRVVIFLSDGRHHTLHPNIRCERITPGGLDGRILETTICYWETYLKNTPVVDSC